MTPGNLLADALRGALVWQQQGWPGLVSALETSPPPLDPDTLPGLVDEPRLGDGGQVHDVGYRSTEHSTISGFTRFVDGTQHTVALGTTLSPTGETSPVLYFLGAATVLGRSPARRTPRTVALERFDGLLLADDATVPAGVPAAAVHRMPADVLADLAPAIDLVRARRRSLETALARAEGSNPDRDGWMLIDGDLAQLGDLDRTVGVVKRTTLSLAPTGLARRVLALQPGQRSGLFTVTYGSNAGTRSSWFLRLRPAAVGDPAVGVIRVEANPDDLAADPDGQADQISRWLLAERGRPGADVHNPILMIEIAEARMRAALPERAWLARLFPRR